MKILVTGGAGFIGAHTAKNLLDPGDEIIDFDKLTYGLPTTIINFYNKLI